MTAARCLFCGHQVQLVWVHGHGQCPVCKTNAAPCCDGATACPAPPVAGRQAQPS